MEFFYLKSDEEQRVVIPFKGRFYSVDSDGFCWRIFIGDRFSSEGYHKGDIPDSFQLRRLLRDVDRFYEVHPPDDQSGDATRSGTKLTHDVLDFFVPYLTETGIAPSTVQ